MNESKKIRVCKLFSCGSNHICCTDCKVREGCLDPCRNKPQICGQVINTTGYIREAVL